MEEPQSVSTPASLDRLIGENSTLNQSSPSASATGVGNCYVFKSRLQEYAQKVGIPTPVYQTLKEGPSHEPVFKSTVIVSDVKYESLPGFFNRKAAEQSAAEVALMEIHRSGQMTETIPVLHKTGLCKNLLQEYAQKMNYAIPSYKCNRQEEGAQPFICTVEIGGIQYIGGAAKTKKEAEIKAARTALLAIKDGSNMGANGASQHTVLPIKKKGREQESRYETVEQLKAKKTRMKKKWSKRKFPRNKGDKAEKSENDESLNPVPVDKEENASIASNKDENEHGSGGMKDEHQSQTNELKASAMEPNGSCKDEKNDGSTTSRAECVEEPREGEITDSTSVEEVETDAVGDIFSVRAEE